MQEVSEKYPEIYSYILQEENNFRTERVPLASNWRDWNMFEHIDRSFTLLNSRFYKGAQDYTRPFNNIILPIRAVNIRSEGFDFKDFQVYVDNAENYHKSFIARKMNIWWAKENKIDTAIDESVESYFDYGLTLAKNVNEARPEIVQLQQIAFCDQTDIMSGPICLKHNYSVGELIDMKGKWYDAEIDTTVKMSKFSKTSDQAYDEETKTPSKYIEVYELHGTFPESWLGKEKLGEEWVDTGKYSPQIHIVSYYISPVDGKSKVGVCLFKGKEPKPIFKALERDPIFGRACGRGGIEELFHPQIWTNYSELQIQQMLEATAKVILLTNDKKLKNQKLGNIKHGQTLELSDGKDFRQLQLQPINKVAFDNNVNKWEQIARTIGSASDPQLGLNPTSGTPLGTTEIVTQQGVGIHEYRQGKIADFWAEIYRDWTLPHFRNEINKGSKWLDDLSLEELQEVADKVSTKQTNKRVKDLILQGKMVTPQEVEIMKETVKQDFMKGGSKRFLEAVKNEVADLPMDVEISIKNKQKDLAETTSKLNAVFRGVFNPVGMQILKTEPAAGELLNQILESSGLKQINFGVSSGQMGPPSPMGGSEPSPVQPQGELATV